MGRKKMLTKTRTTINNELYGELCETATGRIPFTDLHRVQFSPSEKQATQGKDGGP